MGGIVWLASYPKSGNTWARSFLHNILRPKGDTHDINAMQELTAYENMARWYHGLLPKPLKDCSYEEVARARPKAQERLAAAAEGLVFVKTHNALAVDYGNPIINTKVTAGAVYIVRNPLDVAISYAHHLSATIDQAIEQMNTPGIQTFNSEFTAYEWMGSWTQNVESWTAKPHQAKHVMRYEDMLDKPEDTFGELCAFLHLSPSRAALSDAIEKSSFARLKEQEEKAGFHEKPQAAESFFREGKAGAWREKLSREHVERIVGAHREQMRRFGYLPEGP